MCWKVELCFNALSFAKQGELIYTFCLEVPDEEAKKASFTLLFTLFLTDLYTDMR